MQIILKNWLISQSHQHVQSPVHAKQTVVLHKADAQSTFQNAMALQTPSDQKSLRIWKKNKTAVATILKNKKMWYLKNRFNTVTVMPLARATSKLSSYLAKTAHRAMIRLRSADSGEDDKEGAWLSLAQSTLGQTVMFNRRRSGEVSKMKLEEYRYATNTQRTDTDVHTYLSEVERSLCKVLTRVEIAGKEDTLFLYCSLASSKKLFDSIQKCWWSFRN